MQTIWHFDDTHVTENRLAGSSELHALKTISQRKGTCQPKQKDIFVWMFDWDTCPPVLRPLLMSFVLLKRVQSRAKYVN